MPQLGYDRYDTELQASGYQRTPMSGRGGCWPAPAIIKRAAELSGGRVRLAAGTLYAALDRLTTAELVSTEREEVVNGRARRYYRLTDAGHHALEAEAARMTEAARLVTGRARHRRLNPGTRPA